MRQLYVRQRMLHHSDHATLSAIWSTFLQCCSLSRLPYDSGVQNRDLAVQMHAIWNESLDAFSAYKVRRVQRRRPRQQTLHPQLAQSKIPALFAMAHPTFWPTKTFFYPIGNTSPVNLAQTLPREEDARILLLGCGDPRNILYTLYATGADDTLGSSSCLLVRTRV